MKIVEGFLSKNQNKTLCPKDATGKFGRILGKFEIYDSKTDLTYDDG